MDRLGRENGPKLSRKVGVWERERDRSSYSFRNGKVDVDVNVDIQWARSGCRLMGGDEMTDTATRYAMDG
jgi:hypothetical protein